MLSRVAEGVFILNRCIERAENIARVLDVNLQLELDLPGTGDERWTPILAALGDEAPVVGGDVLHHLTCDAGNPNSILSCVRTARDHAASVREILSSECWEQVGEFCRMVEDAAAHDRVASAPHEFFTAVKKASALFVGVSYLTMSHNEPWHFGRLGRLLERADATSRLLAVKVHLHLPELSDIGSPYDEILWIAVLKSASAFEMYRKAHGRISPRRVAAFLAFDRKFPRSMRYCVVKAERSLHAITGRPIGSYASQAEQRLGRLRLEMETADLDEIAERGLQESLSAYQGQLRKVGEAMRTTFFAPQVKAAGSRRAG